MDLEDLYDDNNKLKVPLRRSLAENKKVLGILFENCGDVVQKSFAMERAEGMVYMHVVYIDGLTNNGMIEETILKPLSYEWRGNSSTIFDVSVRTPANRLSGITAWFPAIMMTAIVSPIARPIPRIMAARIPDFAAGSTAL